jgi:AcrR family transcriptional regulator
MRPAGQTALLEAARQEFAERGFGSASIRNIAQRAGMSLSAMYHYYSGKQELLHALLDEGMDRYTAYVSAELERVGDTPHDRLGAVVAATTRFRGEHATRSNILLLEERSLEGERLAEYGRRQAQATNYFRDPIDAGVASGEFHTRYPEEARRAVIAMCNAVSQWYRPDGPLGLEALIDRHVDLALILVEYRPQRNWSARGE